MTSSTVDPLTSQKIIFLDINGVLLTTKTARIRSKHPYFSRATEKINDFNAEAVTNLLTLLDKTEAKIVLSSSLRRMGTVQKLQQYFNAHGFGQFIIDKIDDAMQGHRGHEIKSWLDKHPHITQFVIIDDLVDEVAELFPDQLAACQCEVGFADPTVLHRALQILKRPH